MRKKVFLAPALSVGVLFAPVVMAAPSAAPSAALPAAPAGMSRPGLKAEPVVYRNQRLGRASWRSRHGRWGARRHSSWRAGVSTAPETVEAAAVQKEEPATGAIEALTDSANLDRRFMAKFAEEPRDTGLMTVVGPVLRRIGRLISPQEEHEKDAVMLQANSDDAAVIGRLSAQWVKKISPANITAASAVLSEPQMQVRDVAGGWLASTIGAAGR